MSPPPPTPAVSIVLPTFNRARLLRRSIESVLAQTDGDFELIVVDDGSADDTDEVVRGSADPRVVYLRLPQNRGLPAARNAGIDIARGTCLAFQDSDDVWLPEKLERQRRLLAANPDAAVVYCDMLRIGAGGERLYFRSPGIVPQRLVNPETGYWQTYMLAMQPTLIRRACLAETRFDERLVFFEDLDLHLRLARHHRYVYLPEPLVEYHDTGGMTADRRREMRGRLQLLRKYAGELLRSDPAFLARETIAAVLRRSLMPVVNLHLTPLC